MAKNYYIADLHLGHEKIIELCSRPFSSIEEMDEALIAAWNKKVHKDDRVYIVGDLIYKSATDPEKYLSRLKGKKYLILGNHDGDWLGKIDEKKWFEEVSPMLTVNTGHGNGMLCHYPVIDYRAKYLIHGHVHLRYGQDPTRVRRLGQTQVINVSQRYVLEIEDGDCPPRDKNRLIWKNGEPKW